MPQTHLEPEELELRIETLLAAAPSAPDWQGPVRELFDRYRAQQRILDRLTHISDRFQAAERDRSQGYLARYERQVRQLEKIVRISDQYQTMLHKLKESLEHASNYDALTNLPNRRCMTRRLEEAAAQAARMPGVPFVVMIADIDHFKSINDTFGHAVGDQALQAVAKALTLSLREYDLCARWGGEEFLLLFPACEMSGASQLAERLRRAVANVPEITDGFTAPTISIGYTVHSPEESIDQTLLRADKALYAAKAAGRNCIAGE